MKDETRFELNSVKFTNMSDLQTLEVHYRWQYTRWNHLDVLPGSLGQGVFPTVVIDDECLNNTELTELTEYLDKLGITFEEFIELVPDGYIGTTKILES